MKALVSVQIVRRVLRSVVAGYAACYVTFDENGFTKLKVALGE
jgi:hypothetical protein